ncbi:MULTISPECIES: hypothetical protein [Actinomycetes]|uniref:Uncharacterized protein n=1 Tax=Streptomyces similanensis TaxID=1274988 RepID=A0ABP9LU59_9ACTN
MRVPGLVYAALHACHPPGSLPDWLTGTGPRCATGATVDVVQEHAEELADLVATAWWECLQDDAADPFTTAFAAACEAYLHPPTRTPAPVPVASPPDPKGDCGRPRPDTADR